MGSSANYSLPIGFVLQGQVYTYTIEKVLGQGSFGITYLASTLIQGPLGDVTVQVAVKEFFAKELDSRRSGGLVATRTEGSVAYKYAKAFQRESRNLSRMKHPGIVRVLEAFDANGTHYYSMEYLSGGSLDDKVKGVGIPETEALSLVRKIGDALSYMHASKIMHLDLKPKNIMLKGNGSPVIIDFGLSKQYDDEGEPESSSSIGLGTPGYAPLEQATQSASREFQPTLDIYALGATLYKILTGATPPEATLILNRKASPQTLLQNKGISESTIQAVQKAMSPIVEDRPQSVADFLLMLEGKGVEPEHEAEDETEPKPVPKPTASHAPAEKPPVILSGSEESKGKPQPKTWLWALLGGLAALAVAAVFLFGGEGHNKGAGDSGADTLSVVPEKPITPVNGPVREAPGSIRITSEPSGAAIWLDGKKTNDKTPAVLDGVLPGKHLIRLVLDNYKDYKVNVVVSSDQQATVSKQLERNEYVMLFLYDGEGNSLIKEKVAVSSLSTFIRKQVISKYQNIVSAEYTVSVSQATGTLEQNQSAADRVASVLANCFKENGIKISSAVSTVDTAPTSSNDTKYQVTLIIERMSSEHMPSVLF